MTAGLLLAVAGEADVDRQFAGLGEPASRAQQQVELALVVGDAAGVEVLARISGSNGGDSHSSSGSGGWTSKCP